MKGTTGLFTTMILGANPAIRVVLGTDSYSELTLLAAHASSPATADALLHELHASQPEFLKRITRSVPPMLPKAYRWVGEMKEIAEFVGEGEGETYTGISKTYKRIEKSLSDKGQGEDVEVLKRFVEEAKQL